ncbi:MAG: Methyltransferase type 11 [Modestobacter sp.]|nr:Methyltransferase type 11 [Modestobacter sp.]
MPLVRNDPAQYDELAGSWWEPTGGFAMLHWLAASRAEHVPPAPRPDAVLVDLACGGGLMAPHVQRLGYRHVGVDIGVAGLRTAREPGVSAVRGSVLEVPLADGCADVVVCGEVLEHVEDDVAVLAECARLLVPGGVLVIDAIADSRLAGPVAVGIAGLGRGGRHDPARALHPQAPARHRRRASEQASNPSVDADRST